jgi:DNA-binding transcriptional MerR regulator
MTPEEVAAYCRVSARQVRRWREIGLLPAVVSAWRPRYRREDVLNVIHHLGKQRT